MPPTVRCEFVVDCARCDRSRAFTTLEEAERFQAEHHARCRS